MKRVRLTWILLGLLMAGAAVSSNLTLPYVWTVSMPDVAELNAVFAAIETAVDDNDARLDALLTTDTCTSPPCDLTSGTTIGGAAIVGPADNLGNHTATQDLDLDGFSILNPLQIGGRIWYAKTETEIEDALTAMGVNGYGAANGHNPTGGIIQLEGGTIDVCNIAISGTTTGTARSGVLLRGVGGGASSGPDGYRNQGTILKGTCADSVLEIGAGMGIAIENLSIAGEDTATGGIEILDNTAANVGLAVRNVGIFEINGYGIIGNTTGQWDTAIFDNVVVSDSKGCYHQRHTQTIGIIFQNFSCTTMIGTAQPAFDIETGEFALRDSFVSLKTNSQVGFELGETTGGIFIENNQIELDTATGVTVVDDNTGANPTNDASRVFAGNNVVWANTGTVLFDVAHRGNYTVNDNTFQVTGSTEYAATATFNSDGSASGRLILKLDNNSLRNSDSAQSTRPEVWLPTIGSGVVVKLPTIVAATLPSFCLEGQIGIQSGDMSQRICNGGTFKDPGLVFEGATNDASETTISITDPTADRTVTIPNANSTTVQPQTCPGGQHISAISSSGAITCS